jgi:hypothetical protein
MLDRFGPPDLGHGMLHFVQSALRNIEQPSARGRQSNLSSGSIEQSRPELGFQLPYQNAQPPRGDEQCSGCAREIAMLRDQLERPELLRGKIEHLIILIKQ